MRQISGKSGRIPPLSAWIAWLVRSLRYYEASIIGWVEAQYRVASDGGEGLVCSLRLEFLF
jgi:hypothetical protein